jgi:hypothetical protein
MIHLSTFNHVSSLGPFHVFMLFHVVAVILLGSGWPPTTDACSMPVGWHPPTLVETDLHASDNLYGKVSRTFPDPKFSYSMSGQSSAYTAEVEVYCVMKGRQSERLVNVTEAGYVPGLCHSSNLTVDGVYILLVRYDTGVYRIASGQIDATDENLQEVVTACGLQQIYPTGVDQSTAPVQCPRPSPPGQCKTLADFPTPSPPAVGAVRDDEDYDAGDADNMAIRHPVAPHPADAAATHMMSSLASMVVTVIVCLCIFMRY